MKATSLCIFLAATLVPGARAQDTAGQIELNAGSWKTWVISSGKDFRVPPPPDAGSTKGELDFLRAFVAEKDPGVANTVKFWDAGPPGYRWIELLNNRVIAGADITPTPPRLYALVASAMYDATIAAWESKYAYRRPRPAEADATLRTRLPTPRSPSYPSEFSATAFAAAGVLSYFFPNEAASFQGLAEEAGKSRLYAGLEFPSDYTAGADLGRRVAAQVIDRAKTDGGDAVWTGTIPTGKCNWIGAPNAIPVYVTAPGWKPFLLSSASEFRPPPPPDCDSPEAQAALGEVRNFPRSPATAFGPLQRAVYWQSLEGVNFFHFVIANRWMFEDRLDQNAPRAARVYSMIANVYYDALIADHDAKYTYWYIRPSQLDPSIVPSIPVPNHPSYPSNHAALTTARMDVLAYLFPQRVDEARAVAVEAAESRIWGGIHYRTDLNAGYAVGHAVAGKYIAWASADDAK